MKKRKEIGLEGSVTMAWYFAAESNDCADAALTALESGRAIVSSLWPLVKTNTVLVGARRKRSTEAQATAWLGILETLSIEVDGETASLAWSGTLALARSQNLSAYDASYLELAMRRGLPLATLDEKLKPDSLAVGVAIY